MANNGFDVKWAAPQVADWLNSEYPTSNLAPKFEGLSGSDMMGFKLEDLIAITNVALGRALYNKLHPTAPPPGPQGTAPALNIPNQAQTKKRWTYGTPTDSGTYHVPEANRCLNQLYRFALNGGYFMVQGSYRSGKTSHLIALASKLKNSIEKTTTSIRLTLTPGLDSEQQFFAWIREELIRSGVSAVPLNITSYVDVETALAPYTNIVFLIDEAQSLVSYSQAPRFLAWLKSYSEQSSKRFLSAFAFGTFSSSHIVSQNRAFSPFHLDGIIYLYNLNEEQTASLFLQWALDEGVTITDEVIEDLYCTSGGYPGVVGLLGTYIAQIDFTASKVLDFNTWIKYARGPIVRIISEVPQFSKIVQQQTPAMKECVQLLLASTEPFFCPEKYVDSCLELADKGVLSMFDINGTASAGWYFTSPLFRELLIRQLAAGKDCPLTPADLEDPRRVVQVLTEYMNKDTIALSQRNTTTGFPPESIFQGEWFGLLYAALHKYGYHVMIECRKGLQRLDVLVSNGKKVAIEFKSAKKFNNLAQLDEAVAQISDYVDKVGASYGILVNFCPVSYNSAAQGTRTSQQNILIHVFTVAMSDDFATRIVV